MSAEHDAQDASDWAAGGGRFDPEDAEEVDPGPSDTIGDRWRTLRGWGPEWLTSPPPPRRYLLTDPNGIGVLPLGRVGMLVGAGGGSKSWWLCLLALCVATGRALFGTFRVPQPGYVLLALAEEEAEELRRRLYWAAQALDLTEAETAWALDRIVALPLCGRPVGLTYSHDELRAIPTESQPAPGQPAETPFARSLQGRLLNAGFDWRLVVLDPASRYAGPDVEIDNSAATRFVQALERLTEIPGHPTVLIAHHTSKGGRGAGEARASDARGSSALTDGVRWQGSLRRVDKVDHAVQFEVVKSNYGLFPRPLTLWKGEHGVLRLPTSEELRTVTNARRAADQEKHSKAHRPRPSGNRDRVSDDEILDDEEPS